MKVKEWIEKLQKRDPEEIIAMELWQAGDFEEAANDMDKQLTSKEIIACMNLSEISHNAEIGINWDSIQCNIESIIDDREGED